MGSSTAPFDERSQGVFNVKHPRFGARGDGVTNDTVAIQAAHDAAMSYVQDLAAYPGSSDYDQSAEVVFPPGIYSTDTITWNNEAHTGTIALKWRGMGAWNSVLTKRTRTGSNPIVDLDKNGATLDQYGVIFENLMFNGYEGSSLSGTSIAGVKVTTMGRVAFRDCQFWHLGYGIDATAMLISNFYNCKFGGCGTGLKMRATAFSSVESNINVLRDSSFVANVTGIDFTGGCGLLIDGCTIESNTGTGIIFGHATDPMGAQEGPSTVRGCWFEANALGDIDVLADGGYHCQLNVRDTLFWSNSERTNDGCIRVAARTGAVFVDGCAAKGSSTDPLVKVVTTTPKVKVVNSKAATLTSGGGANVTAVAGDNF